MPWRYVIMTLGCLANIIAYSDRSNLSLAIVPIQREYGLSEGDVGVALGGFFMGYIFTQVLGGYLAFHLGPKRVLIFAVAFWSAATILTPAAASCGLGMLVAARVAIGLGEGLCLKEGMLIKGILQTSHECIGDDSTAPEAEEAAVSALRLLLEAVFAHRVATATVRAAAARRG